MIIGISRINSEYLRVFPHYEGVEAFWLSPGGLEYLRNHVGYRPYDQELAPENLVRRLRASKHLRPMCEAPPTGAWADVAFEPSNLLLPPEPPTNCGCVCGRGWLFAP